MIAIALPGDAGDYDMTTIEIEVYEYNSNAGSKIRVSAHTWSSGIGWYNYSISTDGVFNKSIYLGKSSSKYYILLGDTSSSWNYGSVIVRANTEAEFYNNVTPWGDAWSVTQVTTDPTSSKTSNLNTTSSRTSYTYGYSESGSSFRSPIFYDSNDTGYYMDPNGTSNIVSLTQAGYSQNAPIMGKWYSTDTYVYIAPTIYYYYIKVANLASNTSIGNLEYYCKKDSNYPGAVSGKVSVATYSASSMSVQHDQIGGNGSMTPQVILDNNRDVWLRMAGAAWNHEFRWRWTYNSGVTTYDGSTKQTTQPSNSDVIDAGESYRYSWNNVSSSTAYDNRNIVYSLSSSVDTRSPVFYDLNNTAYYIDPASNSNLYSLDIGIQSFDNNGNFDIGDTVGINSGTSMHCDGSNIKIESGAGFVYFSSGTSGNYFGGGIRVGGTGTANELDDYEEGTWTLSFAYAYQGGVTAYSVTSFGGYSWTGRYVKIGRLVHCTFYFSCTSFPWSVNTTSQVFMLDSSFPFALDSTTKAVNGSYYSFPGFSSSGTSNAEVTGVIFPQGYVSSYGAGFVADKGFYSNFEGPDTDAFNLGPGTPFTLKGSFQYYTAS
jgi:hypothetical protein